MNQHKLLNNILFSKKSDNLQDIDSDVSIYMTQRWISMHSPYFVEILNISANKWHKTLSDSEIYKLLIKILPKSEYKRINYIKTNKEKTKYTKKEKNTIYIEDNLQKLEESYAFVFGEPPNK